jgi:hypothetical protein
LQNLGIELPTDEGETELWAIFMSAPSLRDRILAYALRLKKRTGRVFRPLYTLFMSRLICCATPVPKERLLMYHDWFREYHIPDTAMEDLAPYAPVSTMALDAYYHLYVESNTKGTKAMYDSIVPALCRQGEWVLAFKFHRAITNNGVKVDSNPIVDELNSNPTLRDAIYDNLWAMSVEKGERDPLESVALSDIELDQPPPPSPPPMSDAFASRLFATTSFPIKVITAGLRLCKVTEIGPLSIRELLARATSISDALNYMEMLRRSGIHIAESTYAKTAILILRTKQLPLLRDFLDCELHPDTFEDVVAQRNLLKYYISNGEMLASRRTAIVLEILNDQNSNSSPWVRLFRSFCQNGKLPELSVLVDDIVLAGLPLDRAAARLLKGHMYPKSPNDLTAFQRSVTLPFGANINILYLRCGMVPPISLAKYNAIVNGKIGHMDQAYRMLHYMCATLSRGSQQPEARFLKTTTADAPNVAVSLQRCLPPGHEFNVITKLSGLNTIRGIIAWGFNTGQLHLANRTEDGSASAMLLGLKALKYLIRDGVLISPKNVAFAMKERFWMLYGMHPLRDGVSRNDVPCSLEELLWGINAIWPLKGLFPELFRDDELGNPYAKAFLLCGILPTDLRHHSLPPEERMRRRMRLRLCLYGSTPSKRHLKRSGRDISTEEWHHWWFEDATRAEANAIRRRDWENGLQENI